MREQYNPERYTPAEREQATAKELTALGFGWVSRPTVQRMRLAYRKQGLWGLLDHRTSRASNPTGRADERVVAIGPDPLTLLGYASDPLGDLRLVRHRVRRVDEAAIAGQNDDWLASVRADWQKQPGDGRATSSSTP